jgi:hypothetical protein
LIFNKLNPKNRRVTAFEIMKREEEKIQAEIYRWFWNTYCLKFQEPRELMYHVPNEGKDNGRLVGIGLYPGCADLVFTWKGEHHYLELKAPKGTQSPNQKKFEAHVKQSGYKYHLCRSLEEFKQIIANLC